MKKTILLISILFCVSCFHKKERHTKLNDTLWECQIDSNCVNYYKFITDNTFEFYSCEMEFISAGEYYFEDDFLMIHQNVIFDNVDDLEVNRLFKLMITDNYLEHLSVSELKDGKWIESDFKFDSKYKYYL